MAMIEGRADLKHDAESQPRKKRRTGGPIRNREGKIQGKRLPRMPEGKRSWGLGGIDVRVVK
jgi:hypothetical protein